MPTAIYPGTFDPITYGHVDIAARAARIFRRVIAVVADNPGKNPLFSIDERLTMARQALRHIPSIKVVPYRGLIVKCLDQYNATVIIRGLRALSDFEYEFQMAFANKNMNTKAETIFLMASAPYTYLNSSMVKQISRLGGDVSSLVPASVARLVHKKFAQSIKKSEHNQQVKG
jgi:pantetheine-phosphate adenylyltransferase